MMKRHVAVGLAIFGMTEHMQDAGASAQKVEITGTSIKRIAGETALPVQIIRRDDIDKAGIATAAELLRTISANTATLTDGASITDNFAGQRGFNGANLRGIGVSSTLVLLNGRRLANFATPDDNAAVDLNNIPATAIERVEILKDGASAIYGTDAIGGVVDVITRKHYRGADLTASAAKTQEGGVGRFAATLAAGVGHPDTDRFNLFGVLDVQQQDALRSSQRRFIRDRRLATMVPALMSSNTYPANVDLSSAQHEALIAAGLLPPGATSRRINPSAPACNPPETVYAPLGPGGPTGCSYDYMEDTDLYPESRRAAFFGRATFRLDADHAFHAELMHTGATSRYRLSPVAQPLPGPPASILPQHYRDAFAATGLPADSPLSALRFRLSEAGNRTHEVESAGSRLSLDATGTLAGWEYELALLHAENRTIDSYVDGYVLFDQLLQGIASGAINPFGPSSQAGRDLLNQIKVNDAARKSTSRMDSLGAKASRVLTRLEGGDLALAIGAEVRREAADFTPSTLLVSNNIAGSRDPYGLSTNLAATGDAYRIYSAFDEIDAPVTRELEVQLALRHDRYSSIGSTTNPKISMRYQPVKTWLLRASAGTGFRAPSLADLKRPATYGLSASLLTDPQCVAAGYPIDNCTDQYPVAHLSNPKLKPETSRQFSFGSVFEVGPVLTATRDYWNIEKKDVISTLGEQVIVDNPDKYNGVYLLRDATGLISMIMLQKENRGRLKTSGIDVGLDYRMSPRRKGVFTVGHGDKLEPEPATDGARRRAESVRHGAAVFQPVVLFSGDVRSYLH